MSPIQQYATEAVRLLYCFQMVRKYVFVMSTWQPFLKQTHHNKLWLVIIIFVIT